MDRPSWISEHDWQGIDKDAFQYAMDNFCGSDGSDKAYWLSGYFIKKDLQQIRRKIENTYRLSQRIGKKRLKNLKRRGWNAYEAKFNRIHPEKMWDDYESRGVKMDYTKTDAAWLLAISVVWTTIGMELEHDGDYRCRTRAGLVFKNNLTDEQIDAIGDNWYPIYTAA